MEYVNQIGDAQYPPPYRFPGVTILSFRLEADLGALKNLCDRALNIGALGDRGFEFRPISPFVDLEILNYPRMEYGGGDPGAVAESQAPLSLDYTDQNECYVRFLVMKYIAVGSWLAPDGELAVFCPVLFVNNTWSAFSGRDVLGFPKLFGVFEPSVEAFLAYLKGSAIDPRGLNSEQIRHIQAALDKKGLHPGRVDGVWGPRTQTALDDFRESKGITSKVEIAPQTLSALQLNPDQFVRGAQAKASVKSLAFKNYHPNSRASLYEVVSIKKIEGEPAPAPINNWLSETESFIWPWGPGSESELRNDLLHDLMIMPSVQMKEFRDAENPLNACYQAILRSCTFVESVDPANSGLLPPVEVTIHDYPTLTLAASLGIQPGKALRPISQYYVTCDFNFGDVKTLFANSDAGGSGPWWGFWPF